MNTKTVPFNPQLNESVPKIGPIVLKELIKQSTLKVPLYYGPAGFSHTNKFDKEKFAQLIWEIAYDQGYNDGADQTILKERG